MEVIIACEDPATECVIRRLLEYVSSQFVVVGKYPARGGQVKDKRVVNALNNLALNSPVIYLIDLDASDCAPVLKQELLTPIEKHSGYIVNIAVDEVESWLVADREGFASYFQIPIDSLPESKLKRYNGPHRIKEMDFEYKPSAFITRELAPLSKSEQKRAQLQPNGDACKGREYNTAMIPFIKGKWNVDAARLNSDSLNRMILRLENLV